MLLSGKTLVIQFKAGKHRSGDFILHQHILKYQYKPKLSKQSYSKHENIPVYIFYTYQDMFGTLQQVDLYLMSHPFVCIILSPHTSRLTPIQGLWLNPALPRYFCFIFHYWAWDVFGNALGQSNCTNTQNDNRLFDKFNILQAKHSNN